MTHVITDGRSMYKSAPALHIEDLWGGDDPLFEWNAVELVERPYGQFVLQVRHENATDLEHDSSYIGVLEGTGLRFDSTAGPRFSFTGAILEAKYYPEEIKIVSGTGLGWMQSSDLDAIETCGECDDPHLIMPYQPPKQKIKPRAVRITLRF